MMRSAALALALTLGFTGLAEAKRKPVVAKHKVAKAKVRKYKAGKANKSAKSLAKRRKRTA
jgi:hypothetical protein